jgi:hypothetical protein
MLANVKRGYALAEFTVELRAKGWFLWTTYGDQSVIKGPYSSQASVSLMIARRLAREITKRDSVHRSPSSEQGQRNPRGLSFSVIYFA